MKAERNFERAVAGAFLVHAAVLFGLSSYRGHQHQPAATRMLELPSSRDIDLSLLRSDSGSARQGPVLTPSGPSPHGVSSNLPPRALAIRPSETATVPQSGGDGATDTAEPTSSGTEEPGLVTVAPSNSGAPTGHLTRQQLGLDGSHALAAALSREASKGADVAAANERLALSMQQDRVDADRHLGLGVPAPLIATLEAAARELAIPTNATALFSADFDGRGKLLGFDFLQTDHASPRWSQLEQRVEQLLSGKKLSLGNAGHRVKFTLRLVARSQLPSGSDPGTAVDVLGVPVKKGQGKRSPKISLLDPTPKMLELEIPGENGEKIKVPVPGIAVTLLSLAGDPSDIGAPARHMVRVEVVDEKVY